MALNRPQSSDAWLEHDLHEVDSCRSLAPSLPNCTTIKPRTQPSSRQLSLSFWSSWIFLLLTLIAQTDRETAHLAAVFFEGATQRINVSWLELNRYRRPSG